MKTYTKIALTTLLAGASLLFGTGAANASTGLNISNIKHRLAYKTFNEETSEIKQTVNSALQAKAGEYLRKTDVTRLSNIERYFPRYTATQQLEDVLDNFGTLICNGKDSIRLGSYVKKGNEVIVRLQYKNKNGSITESDKIIIPLDSISANKTGAASPRVETVFARPATTAGENPAKKVITVLKTSIERAEAFRRDTVRPQRDYDPTSDANSYFIYDTDLDNNRTDDRVDILKKLSKTGVKNKTYTTAKGKNRFCKTRNYSNNNIRKP